MEQRNQPVISRRTALRGAAIGATVVWVAPAVQAVSMTTAHAASAPPGSVHQPPAGAGNHRPQMPSGNRGLHKGRTKGRGPKKPPPRNGRSH